MTALNLSARRGWRKVGRRKGLGVGWWLFGGMGASSADRSGVVVVWGNGGVFCGQVGVGVVWGNGGVFCGQVRSKIRLHRTCSLILDLTCPLNKSSSSERTCLCLWRLNDRTLLYQKAAKCITDTLHHASHSLTEVPYSQYLPHSWLDHVV